MNFQTPPDVADYMVGMTDTKVWGNILEPTPGDGNIVASIKKYNFIPKIPDGDFWKMNHDQKYDSVVMNPPFSPMKEGYKFLYKCMELSDEIVALMPWLVIINGEKRTGDIMKFGLRSITHLPRTIFKGSRVQCCVLHLVKDWKNETIFINYR
jgi:type I restriction-modification system DNA methylase subunit